MLLAFAIPVFTQAQQDYQWTQFQFNKLAINPAYSAGEQVLSMTAAYRNQWTGLEGAPQTGSFSLHGPVANDRIGLGLQVYHDRLGVSAQTGVYATYSYQLPLGSSVLSLGFQAGIINWQSDLTDLNPLETGDQVFASNQSVLRPSFGAGVYWHKPKKAFVGFSLPRLLEHDLSEIGIGEDFPTLYRHSYLMGGYIWKLNREFSLRPVALLKYAGPASINAPLDYEVGLSALIAERIWMGVSWRSNESAGIQTQWLVNTQLSMAYAYDFGLNDLASYHGGSHEIILRYDFRFKKDGVVNPRSIQYF